MKTLLLLPLAILGVSCAPDYSEATTKMVGVGYNPDEIGPAPTPYGGVVEYSWVNFAGGGLSLALMGLGSFDEVGPNLVGFQPPYAAVYGFSYIFDTKLSSADSLAGVTSVPPDVEDTCYTTFAAGGPIGSFKTVDVGSWLEFRTTNAAQDGGIRFDRTPRDYPANPQDLFVYYLGFDYYTGAARYGKVQTDADRVGINSLEDVLIRRRNFPFGEEVEFRFPGAVTDEEAPVASMPRPSSAAEGGNTRFSLPGAPGGVQMRWSGPRYDSWGKVAAPDGEQATCLSFAAPADTPSDEAACANAAREGAPTGQIYTGPWDTADGNLHFQWAPGNADEYVSLSVRFLGPVDREDPAFLERAVLVPSDSAANREWTAAQRDGDIPEGVPVPGEGRRAPQACEEGTPVFDDAFEDGAGELVTALRGDPFNNVAEVTCRLKDDGDYTLTVAQLEQALTYARRSGAQGAIFYFARSTEAEAVVPAAKGQFGQRREISPVKLTSRAIDIGRFWFEE
jgi:hypothetical protein